MGSNTTNELWYLDADKPGGKFQIVMPRTHEVQYYLDHHGDKFYIMTNENAKNYKIMDVETSNPARANWKEFIPHNDSVKIENIDAFKTYLAVYERSGGLQKIRILNLDTGLYHLPGAEPGL